MTLSAGYLVLPRAWPSLPPPAHSTYEVITRLRALLCELEVLYTKALLLGDMSAMTKLRARRRFLRTRLYDCNAVLDGGEAGARVLSSHAQEATRCRFKSAAYRAKRKAEHHCTYGAAFATRPQHDVTLNATGGVITVMQRLVDAAAGV